MAYMMQGILLIRLIAGGIVVGFSRPSFEPTCVARTSLLPASIAALGLDFIIIGFLIIRAVSLGMFGDLRGKQSALKKDQSKAFILTTTGFVLWTAVSCNLGIFLGAELLESTNGRGHGANWILQYICSFEAEHAKVSLRTCE